MSLRIAFDLDGTLADMEPALEEIAARLFPQAPDRPDARPDPGQAGSAPATTPNQDQETAGDELTPEEEQLEPPSVRMLTRRQQHAIWDEVRRTENFWESLGETEPGIVSRIAAIADERRWEVLFITSAGRKAAATPRSARASAGWRRTASRSPASSSPRGLAARSPRPSPSTSSWTTAPRTAST